MSQDSTNPYSGVLEFYKLKQISRSSSNRYVDGKDGVSYDRRETTAEHVFSCLRLADFFLTTEPEFSLLDQLRVYYLLMYHDDLEIVTGDIGVADREARKSKKQKELEAIPVLAGRLPRGLSEKFLSYGAEFRRLESPEARFANGVDKMDSLVHELQYPDDWGPKNFGEGNVRKWFQYAFEYSPTFMRHFESMIVFLRNNGYFNVTSSQ